MSTSTGKGVIYLGAATGIFVVTGYLTNIWLGRYFGPEVYGQYGIIIAIVSALNLIQTSALPQALSKYLAEDEEHASEILKSGFNLQIALTAALTLIYFFLAAPIAFLLNDPKLIPYIRISALILPFYALFSFYTGYFNGIRNFKAQAVINIIYSVSKFAAILILAHFFKLGGAITGFALAPLLIIFHKLPLPFKSAGNYKYKQLIAASIPLLGFVLLNNFQQVIDLYFIKALLKSDALAGLYTANQNITKLPYIGFCTFIGVLYPVISRNVSKNLHQQSRNIIHQVMRVVLILLIPITLLISAKSLEIVTLLYSTAFKDAAQSLSVLIIGFSFLTVFTILANILNGAGLSGKSIWIALLSVIVTAVGCLILIPNYGMLGAAIANLSGSLFAMIAASYFVYKRFGALVNLLSVAKIVAASLLIYGAARYIYVDPLFLPIFYFLLFALYFSALILTKELSSDDFIYVNKMLPAKLRIYDIEKRRGIKP